MCGISALFGQGSSFSTLFQMTDLIRHRGPSSEGFAFFDEEGNCFSKIPPKTIGALGHRKLDILDSTPLSNQPMSLGGRFWITFNGEIYNYKNIAKKLKVDIATDTELILWAFAAWGKAALHELNGMFAFVLFDTLTFKVFAARDRFGIKPLYFWRRENEIALVSEIKQLTPILKWKRKLNGSLAYDFLNWGMIDHTNGTLFDEVQQLKGGEFLEFDARSPKDSLKLNSWYSLKGSSDNLVNQEGEFLKLLKDSLKEHTQTKVPFGACLSGGLDSSSLVCLLQDAPLPPP